MGFVVGSGVFSGGLSSLYASCYNSSSSSFAPFFASGSSFFFMSMASRPVLPESLMKIRDWGAQYARTTECTMMHTHPKHRRKDGDALQKQSFNGITHSGGMASPCTGSSSGFFACICAASLDLASAVSGLAVEGICKTHHQQDKTTTRIFAPKKTLDDTSSARVEEDAVEGRISPDCSCCITNCNVRTG